MRKSFSSSIIMVVVIALFVSSHIAGDVFGWKAQAQQTSKPAEMKPWEYCSVGDGGSVNGQGGGIAYVAYIVYHQSSGSQREEIESKYASDALSKAVAKLGDNGWEMVSQGDSGYHFKRPKR